MKKQFKLPKVPKWLAWITLIVNSFFGFLIFLLFPLMYFFNPEPLETQAQELIFIIYILFLSIVYLIIYLTSLHCIWFYIKSFKK